MYVFIDTEIPAEIKIVTKYSRSRDPKPVTGPLVPPRRMLAKSSADACR